MTKPPDAAIAVATTGHRWAFMEGRDNQRFGGKDGRCSSGPRLMALSERIMG